MKLLFLMLLVPVSGFASVEIAFVELRNHKGQVIQLEQNGQFAHVAISYQGQWLHSHPLRGVEVISADALEKMGTIKSIMTVPELEPLQDHQIKEFLGKPYDRDFSWNDDNIYCSELIAKLLNIEPQPMAFESGIWGSSRFQSLKGLLGLSPDDIFKFLKNQGYREHSADIQCSKIFG